jgi:hypothetical protein
MRSFALILFLIIALFSCTEKKRDPNLLTEASMKSIMWDLMRADQFIVDFAVKDSVHNKKQESVKLYDEIFRLHKTTAEQFKKSLDYYSSRPELLQPILDSLSRRKESTSPRIRPHLQGTKDSVPKKAVD